jgi:diguanylate cyclase (GGDEF)-like protein
MADADLVYDEARAGAGASVESFERDTLAERRDEAAEDRDREAKERDDDAADRDREYDDLHSLAGRATPTVEADHVAASEDRDAAAADREMASEDRDAAAGDRTAATSEIESLLHDQLTGIYRRSVGLTELGRETLKARRTGETFTLAFIDIDHLKATNDSSGHGAGDRLIVRAVKAIQSVVREYDVVVRYGGDEFLCGALGLTLADAQGRFEQVNEAMAATGGGTASAGVVQLGQDENLDQLIARADAAMFARKRHSA